jgi:hypothetical protein
LTSRLAALCSIAAMAVGCSANRHDAGAAVPSRVCDGARLQPYVGQPATPMVGTEILAVSGAKLVRWVAPDQMVTQDYRADRVTIGYDAKRIIRTISCG